MNIKKVRIGTSEEVKDVLQKLNELLKEKGKNFNFKKFSDRNNLWVVEEEDHEFLNCAVVQVEGKDVYAVSEESYELILKMFKPVLS